ncbi:hypothetical protein DSO57_1016747 [Entomophthora muscae]|uniref:Uncharacterized protein n=2 Tax=Entomophthora muscae TaxID=34485 RepID=A0ACC2TSU6_9FUNG|nr:hypothetical protein DSO57_1016747 [Entomophthora muscae]
MKETPIQEKSRSFSLIAPQKAPTDIESLYKGIEKYGINAWHSIQSDPALRLNRYSVHQLRLFWETNTEETTLLNSELMVKQEPGSPLPFNPSPILLPSAPPESDYQVKVEPISPCLSPAAEKQRTPSNEGVGSNDAAAINSIFQVHFAPTQNYPSPIMNPETLAQCNVLSPILESSFRDYGSEDLFRCSDLPDDAIFSFSTQESLPSEQPSPILMATPDVARIEDEPTQFEPPPKKVRFAYVDATAFPSPPKTLSKPSSNTKSDTIPRPRQRRSWTSSDIDVLKRLAAILGVGNWALIRAKAGASINPSFKACDLKDKWRLLFKKGEVQKPSACKKNIWTDGEIKCLRRGIDKFGVGKWVEISQDPGLKARTPMQIKDKWRVISQQRSRGVRKRNPWTEAEINALESQISSDPKAAWSAIAHHPSLQNRTALELKDKWRNLHGFGDARAFLILDSNHSPYRAPSGAVRIYRNRHPKLAALKAFNKDYLYAKNNDSPSKRATVRILQLSAIQETNGTVRRYSGYRERIGAACFYPTFSPRWKSKARFLGTEDLKKPIRLDSIRLPPKTKIHFNSEHNSDFDSEAESKLEFSAESSEDEASICDSESQTASDAPSPDDDPFYF